MSCVQKRDFWKVIRSWGTKRFEGESIHEFVTACAVGRWIVEGNAFGGFMSLSSSSLFSLLLGCPGLSRFPSTMVFLP